MTHLLNAIKTYWIACTVFLLAVITVLSLTPLNTLPAAPGGDKVHHFIAYGALIFPAALRKPSFLKYIILFFIAYSGTIELVQPYVNGCLQEKRFDRAEKAVKGLLNDFDAQKGSILDNDMRKLISAVEGAQ